MSHTPPLTAAAIHDYLQSRRGSVRWLEWISGRRYATARFADRESPIVVIAHSFRDSKAARQTALAVEQDWAVSPSSRRETYDKILMNAPGLVVVQLRRSNVCGCLGHRHPCVRERPFAEPHEAFLGAATGELDIAYERVESWQALPLSETALDTKFLEGSRLTEFRAQQFRLKLLSILLHEINHLAAPVEAETSVRARSLSFYHDSLAHYVETAIATLALTIDRSFSRLG